VGFRGSNKRLDLRFWQIGEEALTRAFCPTGLAWAARADAVPIAGRRGLLDHRGTVLGVDQFRETALPISFRLLDHARH